MEKKFAPNYFSLVMKSVPEASSLYYLGAAPFWMNGGKFAAALVIFQECSAICPYLD